MAFNVVDQDNNHRGIVLGRYGIDNEIIKSNSGVLWLMGLTNFRVEDLGWGLHQVENYWAEHWKLKTDYGMNSNRFKERIKRMVKIHKRTDLNYEENLRFIHTWHRWKKMRQETEDKRVETEGYLFIDPLIANFRDNKIIIDMPAKYPDSIDRKKEKPVYVKIIDPPTLKINTIYHEGLTIPKYNTLFNVYSGNTTLELTLPFAVSNARKDDFMQLYFDDSDESELAAAYVNGLFYETERKKWSLFG